MKKTISMILIVSLCMTLFSACGKKKAQFATTLYKTEITLDKTEITVECGQTFTLTATVEPADSDRSGMIWRSYNTRIASLSSEKSDLSAEFVAQSVGVVEIAFGLVSMNAICKVTVIETEEQKAEREKAEAEEKAMREKAEAEAKAAEEARAAEAAKTFQKGNITIKLKNDLPTKLYYNLGGKTRSSCEVTEVNADGDTLIVTGKKASDYRGETGNQPCTFRYKLYDSSNTVVDTRICEVYGLVVGETFKKDIYLRFSNLTPGTYTLQLVDYN